LRWALALGCVALGAGLFGWRGALLGFSALVFWLLLQFSLALRALRLAGRHAVGRVDSAVMLHARLRPGMTLGQVIRLTRSLGRRVGQAPERWRWVDAGGAEITLELRAGRLVGWQLTRRAEPGQAASACGCSAGAAPASSR
jgi:hypothetical protein